MYGNKRLSMSEMTLQDIICPICLSILIEPVTMPCSHALCMPCFKQHVSETSLACPVCRMRISVWVRRNTKTNRLINNKLWQMIKEKFPSKVEARLQGAEESDEEEYMIPEPRVCDPGEIRQEYEALIERERKELAARRSQEEEASNKLILQMREEDKMKLRHRQAQEEVVCKEDEILAQRIKEAENIILEQKLKEIQLLCGSDEEIARRLEEEERLKKKPLPANKVPATPTRGPMDIYIGQKTPKTTGKLVVPDTRPCSSSWASPVNSKATEFWDNQDQHPKNLNSKLKSTNFSIMHGSHDEGSQNRSQKNSQSLSRSNSDSSQSLSRSHSGVSHDSYDGRSIGRQLREITSSQSSESDSEDLLMAVQVGKTRRVPGKENIRDSENSSPIKSDDSYRSKVLTPSKRKKKNLVFNSKEKYSDIERKLDAAKSPKDVMSIFTEDSDATDIDDEDPNYKAPAKVERILGKKKEQIDFPSSKDSANNSFEVSTREEVSENDGNEDNDSSMDYALLFSNEEMSGDSLEKLREEQLRVEERLKQEENDRQVAEALQKQLELELRQVDRTRGSKDEYSLRNRRPVAGSSRASHSSAKGSSSSYSAKRERQTTLTEALSKRIKRS